MGINKCTRCGCTYTKFVRSNESVSKITRVYYCENCDKEFSIDVPVNSGGKKWLMNFIGDEYHDEKMEIYQNPNGSISTVYHKDKNSFVVSRSPKLYTRYRDMGSSYDIWCDTYQNPNDPNGKLLVIRRIEMNDELKNRALQNEAMKSIHSKGNIFSVRSSKYNTLQTDICLWLRPVIKSPEISGLTQQMNNSGCYIATAVYGSYNCPQVWILRRFRDNTLASTWYGRAFIRTYYAISPTLVKYFGHTNCFQKLFRSPLDKMVAKLQAQGVKSTPYNDKKW